MPSAENPISERRWLLGSETLVCLFYLQLSYSHAGWHICPESTVAVVVLFLNRGLRASKYTGLWNWGKSWRVISRGQKSFLALSRIGWIETCNISVAVQCYTPLTKLYPSMYLLFKEWYCKISRSELLLFHWHSSRLRRFRIHTNLTIWGTEP